MSDRVPTGEQAAAIAAAGAETIVEAGAGTGKTGVMVERYCRLVCDEGLSPDSVLAFTFTEKAAAELRQRIRVELERRAAAGSERARELIPGLGAAWVTTIHGFCHRILSAHPVAVGVDPRFRVLDAPETERAAGEAFEEALEEFLDAGDSGRERTVAVYDIGNLRGMTIGVHAELRSRGFAEPVLPELHPIDPRPALDEALAVARGTLGELKEGSKGQERVAEAIAALEAAGDSPSLDLLASLRTDSKAKPIAAFREAIDTAAARVAEAGEGGEVYRHLAELLRLFSERFAAAKERRAGIDFEDLQLLAVRLLERTETGAAYSSRFAHVLVDEFQDTNRLQLRLIEALRGPATKLMVVGDELQSIYGFRHADLDVFRERRAAIEAADPAAAIPLSGNFRSRPEVIGAVNTFGGTLLGADYRPLRVGAPSELPEPLGGGPAVEMLLTARDGWDEESISLDPATDARTPVNQLAEARFLASRLRELADAGVPRGSMVVLLRAFTHLDSHEDSLQRAGLRPYVVGGRGYWSQQQVADVCALLATIANPFDDQALFGALASPACGVTPDTLWLLRAAAGRGRHIWTAVEHAAGTGEDERVEERWIEAIEDGDRLLLSRFVETLRDLRRRSTKLTLPGLIDAAVTETGYDLAVLMRPSGEARFANVRKLMRLAADFEAAEGRDLRGLLDFLAARAEADADAQAATAVEGHDGVRIMTVHSAKGLEFDVVAIPNLARGLLPAARTPLLTLGREAEEPRVGMQLRRLGARGLNIFAQRELAEEAQARDAAEELRLFHVAATRARERLLLSGVLSPNAPSQATHGTSVLERLVSGLEIDREADSEIEVAPPEAAAGLDAGFGPSRVPVRISVPSAERAAELTAIHRETGADRETGPGPAPLVARRAARPPRRPLSYTAIAAQEGSEERPPESDRMLGERGAELGAGGVERGRAVHALLEWSQANGWSDPTPDLVARVSRSGEVAAERELSEAAVLGPCEAWLSSPFFTERIRDATRSRAEVPLLIKVSDTVLRGSIDLLVEDEGSPPLIVDYKTDRVGEAGPEDLAAGYGIQRAIYALAVAEARGVEEVDLAYVFLERAEEPVVTRWGPDEIAAGRSTLEAAIARVRDA